MEKKANDPNALDYSKRGEEFDHDRFFKENVIDPYRDNEDEVPIYTHDQYKEALTHLVYRTVWENNRKLLLNSFSKNKQHLNMNQPSKRSIL